MTQSLSEFFKNTIKWQRLFPDQPTVNILLFVLTAISTYVTGGLWYAVAIMSILLFHEMGHYFMCRKYAVPATLPFFIPFPILNPFGTMGAIIRMQGFIPNRRALFDIGAAGPLAGFILCLPAIYWGMLHSKVISITQANQIGFLLGDSLLFRFFSHITIGHLPEGYDVMLHPLAYAGWAGLFVTSLNLLPIGQLDGGHIVYSIFGKNSKKINLVFLGALGGLVIINPGWVLLFALLLMFGRKHPPALDDLTPLDIRRKLLGIIIFLIFLLCFTPVPFKLD
jgi:membrane-associated protease RseP (regulator of RpoE activity)